MDNTNHTNSTHLHDFASLLIGILIGGLAGIGAMMLFAPQSGEKTRATISQKRAEFQDRAIDTFDELLILSQFDNRKILAGTGGKPENSRYLQKRMQQ